MVWEQLSINKPHLVYIILGGFTSLFMLCSSVIKEKFYIGEATIATICGVIFGPHAANLIDPGTWGNTDQITLEFSRIVLVVQCFAVGVELPKYYMEKHWRSVVFLLVPVMTFGYLITSLFIWAMFHGRLDWLDSLVIAACVTATDPVLASSVVGKGKFAQRVPRHLRDLLSAESGCNDGMAFPFVYLGLYLIQYRKESAGLVAEHWICNTILYECVFGAIYGVTVGYAGRRGIRYSHEKGLIDRESFLVFYFVLALFCAGSGSLLGMDDLLVGFAAGVGFSNDGWFLEKTEEAHVSNVIDLLINLAFFVYFGTIIPWDSYASSVIGTTPWKLVVIAILVLFFRRIPIMLALKPIIPDIKTWREALFAGHFGPIGVGALFVAILARAELETMGETTTPLAVLPEPDFPHDNIIELIWPITTFLVITSILIHGSTIAVFTLGKHINTLSLTMSITREKDQPNNWMDRLPRIQSRSKSEGLSQPLSITSDEYDEKMPDYPAATLPKNFLRRQKEEDDPHSPTTSRSVRSRKRKSWDSNRGPGGHVEQSAIAPVRRPQFCDPDYGPESPSSSQEAGSSETAVSSPNNEEDFGKHDPHQEGEPQQEIYEEGDDTIFEDEEGNVLEVMHSVENESAKRRKEREKAESKRLMNSEDVEHGISKKQDVDPMSKIKKQFSNSDGETEDGASKKQDGDLTSEVKKQFSNSGEEDLVETKQTQEKTPPKKSMIARFGGPKFAEWSEKYHYSNREKTAEKPPDRKQGPARAFRFGNTVIVEDEDGEVIKKYELPARPQADRKASYVDPEKSRQRLQRMGKWMGMGNEQIAEAGPSNEKVRDRKVSASVNQKGPGNDDDNIRFTIAGDTRRMSKADFFLALQSMDPKKRAELVEKSDAPDEVKEEARDDAAEHMAKQSTPEDEGARANEPRTQELSKRVQLSRLDSKTDRPSGTEGTLVDQDAGDIPVHNISEDLHKHSVGGMTAAERRRQAAAQTIPEESDSDDDGTERIPPVARGRGQSPRRPAKSPSPRNGKNRADDGDEETAAEKRRRIAALNEIADDSDEDETSPRRPAEGATTGPAGTSSPAPTEKPRGIRFAGEPSKESHKEKSAASKVFGSVRWGGESGR